MTHVLLKNGVLVDGFSLRLINYALKKGQKPVMFLTHFHGDSIQYVPKGIRNIQACQNIMQTPEKMMCGRKFCYSMVPGEISFFKNVGQVVPFLTDHCCNSVGFWFAKFKVLYVGDSRVNNFLIKNCTNAIEATKNCKEDVLYVVGDGLYMETNVVFPSLSESRSVFSHVIESCRNEQRVFAVCPHSGVLHFVHEALKNTAVNFETVTGRSFWKKDCADMAFQMSARKKKGAKTVFLVPGILGVPKTQKNSRKFICCKNRHHASEIVSRENEIYILPSSLFFAVNPEFCKNTIVFEKNSKHLRICTSFHASKEETLTLMFMFRNAVFQKAPSRPL